MNQNRTKSHRNKTSAGSGSPEQISGDLLRKVPPHNLEAEKAVLGGIFLKPQILHEILDVVGEDDFYSPPHRTIFQSFLELFKKGVPVDYLTVQEELRKMGSLDEVGGPAYLAEISDSIVSASNAMYHAEMVRDRSIQRGLISSASGIIAECFEGAEDVDTLLDNAEQTIFAISESRTRASYRTGRELVDLVFTQLQERVERKELVTGVPTDYSRLDELTAGLQPSDLIIVAGRPAMGKTAFALNVGMRAAVNHEVPTAIFSLEMSMEQLMMRMLCARRNVDLSRLRRGFLDDDDWARLYDAAQDLSKAPIFIDDTPALSSLDMRARCRRLKAEKGLGLVLVDYLQLMRASRRIDSREQEISEISRSLKSLAKELNVPVMALSQLNRKVEDRTGSKRPILSDLRESGAIEQDADVIMFLYRDEVYNKKEDNPKKGIAEVIIGKQRNGPTGTVELAFIRKSTAFEDLAHSPVPTEYAVEE
jgi:replicative DNA helicase